MTSLVVLPSGAHATVGGITHVSDRQEVDSCRYASSKAPASKRLRYSDACRSARTAEAEAGGLAAMAAAPLSYENPVYGSMFPDPGALRNSSTDYYAYATGGGFPILKSADLVHWEQVGRAFSSRPSWVIQSGDWHPWAPSVLRSPGPCPGTTSPGCYFMYYVGLSAEHTPQTHCVAAAWSLTPSGPFTDLGPIQAEDGETDLAGRPPGCGDAAGYSNIDPAPFVDDDGSVYLYVSTGRRCAQPTTSACPYEPAISVLPMAETPTQAAADRRPLFGATPDSWEQEPGHAATVENPWMEKRDSTYYLFYSGGDYRASYGMGYATASSPTGGDAYPAFTKSALNPILRETDDVFSPGGGSVTAGPTGGSWLVYHGRAADYTKPRTLRIDPVYWSGSSVFTPGPTTGPQTFQPEDTTPPPAPVDPEPAIGEPVEPSANAPAAAPLADGIAPLVKLDGRWSRSTRRRINVIARALSEDVWVTVSCSVRVGGGRKRHALKGVTGSFIAHGDSRTLRVRVSMDVLRAIQRGLRRHHGVRARLTVEARDAAGNLTVRRLAIDLRRP